MSDIKCVCVICEGVCVCVCVCCADAEECKEMLLDELREEKEA